MTVLTTLEKLKTHLDISSTDSADDNLLVQLLDEIEQVIFEYTDRGEELGTSVSFTEYYDGDGRENLYLRRHPVTAIATLSVDGSGFYGQASSAFPSTGNWTQGTDFAIPITEESEKNSGRVIALATSDFRGRGIFPRGKGNIKVIYTAGYSQAPKNLEYAIHQLSALARAAADSGQILGQETLGKYSYKLLSGSSAASSGTDLMTVRSILGRYMT